MGAHHIMNSYLQEKSCGNKKYYEETSDDNLDKISKTRKKNQVSPASDKIVASAKKVDFASRPPDVCRKFKLKSGSEIENHHSQSKEYSTAEQLTESTTGKDTKETVATIDDISRNGEVVNTDSYSMNSTRSVQWEPYLDISGARGNTKNLLMLHGAPYLNVINRIHASDFSYDMFDEIDEIVFQYLAFKHFNNFQNSALYIKYNDLMAGMEIPISEDDFMIFRTLGRGGFGLVSSCKRAFSGKMYAMKMMNKKRIKLKKSEKLCLNELNALKLIDSKYIVCLRYSFTTPTDIFLILDIMTGGDLGFHLQRNGQFTTKEARYYTARLLVALQTLHGLNIVYRDLKPENILMDNNGRTRISDLGLATVVGTYCLTFIKLLYVY
jgi:hypothetical protein